MMRDRNARIVCGAAAVTILLTFLVKVAVSGSSVSHNPAPGWIRAGMGVAWLVLQALSIAVAFRSSGRVFALTLVFCVISGFAIMTAGRYSATPQAWMHFAAIALSLMPLAAAMARLARGAVPAKTGTVRTVEVRLFLSLSALGAVYLYSTNFGDGLAQVRALAVGALVLAVLRANQISVTRLVEALDRVSTHRLAMLCWMVAVLLLLFNGAAMWVLGLKTPQIGIGSVSIAPYQFAVLFVLIAIGLVRQSTKELGPARVVVHFLMFAVSAVCYAKAVSEGGTLLLVLLGAVMVIATLGPARQAVAMGTVIVVMVLAAKTSAALFVASAISDRAAERVASWTGRATPNDQLVRVQEVADLAGVTGQAGAARMNFLVGPQVGKDYLPILILAQGGWLSLAVVLILGMTLFLAELTRLVRRADQGVGRALGSAVFAMFAANLVITFMWLNDSGPLIGIPCPFLARGGSHLMVAALALGGVSFGINRSSHAS